MKPDSDFTKRCSDHRCRHYYVKKTVDVVITEYPALLRSVVWILGSIVTIIHRVIRLWLPHHDGDVVEDSTGQMTRHVLSGPSRTWNI